MIELTPNTAKLVRVDWEDIYFSDNWGEDEDDAVYPKESTTLGYLLKDTPTYIVVGSSYDWQAGQWGTIHAISKQAPDVSVIGE